jgi:hypothetical protein
MDHPLYFEFYRYQMMTKRPLVLVCKSWQILATDLLYEYVRITSIATLGSFLRALQGSLNADHILNHIIRSNGFYTRRLDINFKNISPVVAADFRVAQSCYSILKLCHNIKVLNVMWFSGSGGLTSELMQEISCRLADSLHSLRTFDTRCPIPLPVTFVNLRNLEALVFQLTWEHAKATDWFPAVYPQLHTIEFTGSQGAIVQALEGISKWTLPSLRRVSVRPEAHDGAPTTTLPHFLSAHGPNLTTFKLDCP